MGLFDKTVDALSKSMDLQLLRHAVTSDNIANAETPYYKARRVEFEGALQQAIAGYEEENPATSIGQVKPFVFEDPTSDMGSDLNSVDMDREMVEMKKNEVRYSATSQAVSKKFALMKYAISGEGN